MEILSRMSFCHFELSHLPATWLQETTRDLLWKKSRNSGSMMTSFIRSTAYSNELDIAPEWWEIGPSESNGFQETDKLFLAASLKFESVDERSEPEVDELFKVASQQIELEDQFAEPVSLKKSPNNSSQQFLKTQKSTE